MKRFSSWFRWTWQSNRALFLSIVLASLVALWAAVLLFHYDMRRSVLEGVNLGLFALGLVLLAGGVFNAERRVGAESMLLRLPRARAPALYGRLSFLGSAAALHFFVLALGAGMLAQGYNIPDIQGRHQVVDTYVVFPRWIAWDLISVCAMFGAFGLLASAWTRRSALAAVIGLFLPIVLAIPFFVLFASRSDFLNLQMRGAPNVIAWPLAALGLAAAIVAWGRGHRFLNRPRSALKSGLLVLAIGGILGAAYTAQAFARFNDVDPTRDDFRLSAGIFRFGYYRGGAQNRAVALAAGGRYVYVQGYRHIRGKWPHPPPENYDDDAPHFLEHRGTVPRQWRIDMHTGEAVRFGEGRDGVSFWDLGSGRLRRIPLTTTAGGLAPRSHALFGTPGEGDEVRLLDLTTGQLDPLPAVRWRRRGRSSRVDLVSAAVTPVRDGAGRPVWLRQTKDAERRTGLEICWSGGSRPVDSSARPKYQPSWQGWKPCPGGWSKGAMTIDAVSGVLRFGDPKNWSAYGPFVLSPSKMLMPEGIIAGTAQWSYKLIDLDGGEEQTRTWTDLPRIATHVLPDGRLLTLVLPGDGKQHLRLWDPVADTQESVRMPEDLMGPGAQGQLLVGGTDNRGNVVLLWRKADTGPDGRMTTHQRLVLYRHAARSVVSLTGWHWFGKAYALEIVGIDEQDRVVALERDGDDRGCKRVVRLGPGEGQREVVFPQSR